MKKRRHVSRGSSKRLFKRTVNKSHRRNNVGMGMRGGIRL